VAPVPTARSCDSGLHFGATPAIASLPGCLPLVCGGSTVIRNPIRTACVAPQRGPGYHQGCESDLRVSAAMWRRSSSGDGPNQVARGALTVIQRSSIRYIHTHYYYIKLLSLLSTFFSLRQSTKPYCSAHRRSGWRNRKADPFVQKLQQLPQPQR